MNTQTRHCTATLAFGTTLLLLLLSLPGCSGDGGGDAETILTLTGTLRVTNNSAYVIDSVWWNSSGAQSIDDAESDLTDVQPGASNDYDLIVGRYRVWVYYLLPDGTLDRVIFEDVEIQPDHPYDAVFGTP